MGRRDVYVLAGFLLFLVIYFSGVLTLPGERCLGRAEGDARNQFYGWRAYGFGEVRAGRFPLWNPYEFLGMPFVAALQSAMFYPTNWLCAVLPLGRAINLGIILNLFLSGLFTYLWARRYGLKWVGAVVAAGAYAFGAPQFLRIFEGHWSFLAAMPWIPCLLLCVEILLKPTEGRSPCPPPSRCAVRSGACLCGEYNGLVIAAGAAAVAMQWFAGNPQYAFYGGIAVALYLAGRLWQRREIGWRGAARVLGSFALIYLLGSLLAGVQLIPAMELFSVSSRRGQLSYSWVAQDSFTPESLISFLAPGFFGSHTYWGQWNLWEMCAYVGAVAAGLAFVGVVKGERGKVLLACCAGLLGLLAARFLWRLTLWEVPLHLGAAGVVLLYAMGLALAGVIRGGERGRILLIAGIAAFCLLLALGENGPALKLLYGRVPGFDLFRGLARFLCPMSVFVGLLAGIGADGIVTAAGESRGGLRRAMWVLVAVAALLALGGIALGSGAGPVGAVWERFMHAVLAKSLHHHPDLVQTAVTPGFQSAAMHEAGFSLLRAAVLLAALAIVILAALRARNGKASWIAAMLLVLAAADAWSFGHRYLKTFDPRQDGISPGAVAFLKSAEKKSGPFRFARGGCFTLPPCEGMTHELACIEGVQPNVPARFEDVFWSIQELPKEAHRTSYSIFSLQPAFRMFNLRYLVVYPSPSVTPMPGLHYGVFEDYQTRIDELPNAWPRAWIVHRVKVLEADAALKMLPEFDYEKGALLEEEPGCALEPPPWDDCRAARFPRPCEPDRMEIDVKAASAGLLVLSDLHYPGWRATVDGKPAEILRANYVMRAVAVPQGEHRVEFTYEPSSFKAGIAASAAGCLAAALLVLLHVRRKKVGQQQPSGGKS